MQMCGMQLAQVQEHWIVFFDRGMKQCLNWLNMSLLD